MARVGWIQSGLLSLFPSEVGRDFSAKLLSTDGKSKFRDYKRISTEALNGFWLVHWRQALWVPVVLPKRSYFSVELSLTDNSRLETYTYINEKH